MHRTHRPTCKSNFGYSFCRLTGDVHPNFFGQGPERAMVEAFASHASYPYKLIYANLWFFKPFMAHFFASRPFVAALVRTTTAVTVINGGVKENVLPSSAEALVNHRIHPMQTVADVIEYDRQLINDPNVELESKGAPQEAHPISPYDSTAFGFQSIRRSLSQVFTDTIAIPGILVATTDTRYYLKFTKAVYRFSPTVMVTEEDSKRFHGHNERISVDNYLQTVNFYHHIMLNSDLKELPKGSPGKDEL